MKSQTIELWGATSSGGDSDIGLIYKTDGNGNNLEVLHSLIRYKGASPGNQQLVQASNGKLYGMTHDGGNSSFHGVLFEYDPANDEYDVKIEFDGSNLGRDPFGGMILGSNGLIYGLVSDGGTAFDGVIFSYDAVNDIYTKLFDFDDANDEGWNPEGSLFEATNGKLYGMTQFGGTGGANGEGVLFEFDPDATEGEEYTVLVNFDGTSYGARPVGDLFGIDDVLYGMTDIGGTSDLGVLFKYDLLATPSEEYTKILDFTGTANGSRPKGGLMRASDGMIYGMTSTGGTNDHGTIFKLDPSDDSFEKIFDFYDDESGAGPYGKLIETSDNLLHGTTRIGGANGDGVLFTFDPSGGYTHRLDFEEFTTGRQPVGSLLQASNDKLYGLSSSGGAAGRGTLFEYDLINDTFDKKIDFFAAPDGQEIEGEFVEASNGRLYGTARQGGLENTGVLFEFNPVSNTYTKKIDFITDENGGEPRSQLILAPNGNLYGMTRYGITGEAGTLFEYDPINDELNTIVAYDGTNGNSPQKIIINEANNTLYGIAEGGENDVGVLFAYDLTNESYAVLIHFETIASGHTPTDILLDENIIYGTTYYGGTGGADFGTFGENGLGVFYEYNLATDTYDKKIDFDGTTSGIFPMEGLIQASNGKIYGTTSDSEAISFGSIFEYDPVTESFNENNGFDFTIGAGPFGLVEASNGKLYGLAEYGGDGNDGTFFEFDPNDTDPETALSLKFNMNDVGGQDPIGLINVFNGKLYGITGSDPFGSGVLFEYDPSTDAFTEKHNTQGIPQLSFEYIVEKGDQNIEFSASNKTYGDAPFTLSATSNSSNTIAFSSSNQEAISVSGESATVLGAGTTTLSASQAESKYYNAGSTDDEVIVAKAVLTVTPDNKTKVYGELNPDFTWVYDGFANDENEAVLNTRPTVETNITLETSVGTYEFVASGGEDNNYSFSYEEGQLIITKADLMVSADDLTIPEHTEIPELTISYAGFVNGDTENDITPPTISTTATSTSQDGTYPIVLSGGIAQNYELTLVNGTLTIEFVLNATQLANTRLKIYPNPADDYVVLEGIQIPIRGIRLVDQEGKIRQDFSRYKDNHFDISSVSSGVYYLIVDTDIMPWVARFIVR
ncbi:choice-of-anchor tandem repeat GloVer-containing protein [Reichenbachiella faecimaris]|uniref:choice-of-anchor tandem repeat GloVer-containing protein n=1 Tax=Reichenbachiella faecimaris TaxID=692418 RepID=UPI001594D9F1|nr:choice-of-anchor tandem repeat GloVer-containing protein [Reichenbachiella faecimaris]